MNKLKLFFKRLFCKHQYVMIEQFHGDRKNIANGILKCTKCGKERYF